MSVYIVSTNLELILDDYLFAKFAFYTIFVIVFAVNGLKVSRIDNLLTK